MKTYQQKWQEKNREKIKEYNRKSYKKHKAKRLEAKRLYCSKNKLKIREQRNERYKKRKAEIFKALKNQCKHCGNSDIRVLQIDHINGGGRKEIKSFNSGGYLHYYYKQLVQDKITFLKKYQLLCANCNWIKRIENKEN